MAISTSRLRAMGLAKESTRGTEVTTPTRYINGIPPDNFTPSIEPLPSKGIEALRNMYPKITQGPGTLNGMKIKLEAEPDNIGEILQAIFGADAYTAAGNNFIILSGINDAIDFTVSAVAYTAYVPNGIYTASALETAIAAAMNAVDNITFAATITATKFVISAASNFQLNTHTGAHYGVSAIFPTLGYSTSSDTASNTNTYTAGSIPIYTTGSIHSFVPQQIAQPPTYTWWFDKFLLYPLFYGSMCNKMGLTVKAKSIVEVDTEWIGLGYDGTNGVSESTSFSKLPPFVFSNAVVKVAGSIVPGYDNFKLEIGADGKADHALNTSIWPYTSYSEGFTPQVSAELFFENLTEYNKFLAGTTTHINLNLTFTYNATVYTLIIDIPMWYYKAAPLHIPSNGPLKVPFSGMAQYASSQGYDCSIILVNDVTSSY